MCLNIVSSVKSCVNDISAGQYYETLAVIGKLKLTSHFGIFLDANGAVNCGIIFSSSKLNHKCKGFIVLVNVGNVFKVLSTGKSRPV